MSADRIARIEAREHALALPAPLRIGPLTVADRRYTSVHVHTEDGRVGVAFAQSRGAPVAETVERLLAPVLLGREPADVHARWEDMYRSTIAVGRVGVVLRALSLVDVALWDLLGQRAGLPVHRLLGGYRERVPVTYVAGYPRSAADVDDVVRSAIAAAAAGHATVKVARTPDPALTRAMLQRLDRELAAEVRVQIDANWVWSSVPEALAELRTWPVERLLWVEDPFPPEQEEALAELRRVSPVALAVGDELADPTQARRLLARGAIDVLRLDVLTIGGITATVPLVAAAREAGVPVSFHISPETALHVACGVPGCRDVETFDRAGNPFDPAHELVAGGPRFAGGAVSPSAAPGIGFGLSGDAAA